MKVLGTMPVLDIHTTNANVQIRNNYLTLNVNSVPAQMKVTKQAPRMKVSRPQNDTDAGFRNNARPRRFKTYHLYNADHYTGDGIPTLNEISEEGLAAIQDNSQDTVSAMPADNIQSEKSLPDTGLSAIKAAPLQVEWEKGMMDIEWSRHSLEINWDGEIYPDITVTPYSVEIRVLNGRKIRLSVDEGRIYNETGKRVDTEL